MSAYEQIISRQVKRARNRGITLVASRGGTRTAHFRSLQDFGGLPLRG